MYWIQYIFIVVVFVVFCQLFYRRFKIELSSFSARTINHSRPALISLHSQNNYLIINNNNYPKNFVSRPHEKSDQELNGSVLLSFVNRQYEIKILCQPYKVIERCSGMVPPKLLIMITSIPEDYLLRETIRNTWARPTVNTSVFFVIGQRKSEDKKLSHFNQSAAELWNVLVEENRKYGDTLVTTIMENAINLTLKTYMMMYAAKTWCSNVLFVMKTDSDILNIPENLLTLAQKHWSNDSLSVIGFLWHYGRFSTQRSGKYGIPRNLYPNNFYPAFTSGTGYLMLLFEHAKDQPWLGLEDVFFTGLVAQSIGIHRKKAPGFFWEREPRCSSEAARLYTSREYKDSRGLTGPSKIQRAWNNYLKALKTPCTTTVLA